MIKLKTNKSNSMHKIFKDHETKKKYIELYELLDEDQQKEFSRLVHEEADRKVTRLDDIDDFYITVSDLKRLYQVVTF